MSPTMTSTFRPGTELSPRGLHLSSFFLLLENVLSALKGVAEQSGRGRTVAGRTVEPFQQPSDIDGRIWKVMWENGSRTCMKAQKKCPPRSPLDRCVGPVKVGFYLLLDVKDSLSTVGWGKPRGTVTAGSSRFGRNDSFSGY